MKVTMVVLEGGVIREVHSNFSKQRVEIIDFDPKGDDFEEEKRQEERMKDLLKRHKLKQIY